mmetsp:Transcript_2566/g.7727  ORF Transcript_2566/g.7727 Transcript_2566/m.7727 type:complete len:261 (+) Transcript_2566:79-861(+)
MSPPTCDSCALSRLDATGAARAQPYRRKVADRNFGAVLGAPGGTWACIPAFPASNDRICSRTSCCAFALRSISCSTASCRRLSSSSRCIWASLATQRVLSTDPVCSALRAASSRRASNVRTACSSSCVGPWLMAAGWALSSPPLLFNCNCCNMPCRSSLSVDIFPSRAVCMAPTVSRTAATSKGGSSATASASSSSSSSSAASSTTTKSCDNGTSGANSASPRTSKYKASNLPSRVWITLCSSAVLASSWPKLTAGHTLE